jgi:type VI protein secretion system component VasK
VADSGSGEDRVDLDELVERNEPLANLVKVLQTSNTWRDEPKAIAEDLSIAMKAKDEASEIGKAFSEFEESVQAREDIDVEGLSRKEIAARLTEELRPKKED